MLEGKKREYLSQIEWLGFVWMFVVKHKLSYMVCVLFILLTNRDLLCMVTKLGNYIICINRDIYIFFSLISSFLDICMDWYSCIAAENYNGKSKPISFILGDRIFCYFCYCFYEWGKKCFVICFWFTVLFDMIAIM